MIVVTISLNPDTVIDTWMRLGRHLAEQGK
jgi:hypothetical protein